MKKKTLLIQLFVFGCLLISCRTIRQDIQKTEMKTELETEKVVTYKDTTLFAPKAETSLKLSLSELVFKNQLNSDSKPITYSQKNGQAKVKIKIVHDTIQVFASCDSLAIVAKIKQTMQKESLKNNSNNTTEKTKKTGYTIFNLIIAFLCGFGFCFLLKTFKVL